MHSFYSDLQALPLPSPHLTESASTQSCIKAHIFRADKPCSIASEEKLIFSTSPLERDNFLSCLEQQLLLQVCIAFVSSNAACNTSPNKEPNQYCEETQHSAKNRKEWILAKCRSLVGGNTVTANCKALINNAITSKVTSVRGTNCTVFCRRCTFFFCAGVWRA